MESRRSFLSTAVSWSLLAAITGCEGAVGSGVRPEVKRFVKELDTLTRDLRTDTISQTAWQDLVIPLFARVSLEDVLAAIDYDRVLRYVHWKDRGATRVAVKLPLVDGVTPLSFEHQIFAMKKGRSIVPHGHNDMVSCFYGLTGTVRARHYERITDDGRFMVIDPSADHLCAPTQMSTVSDFRTNVHWVTAETSRAVILNIHVKNLESHGAAGRVYIDPHGERIAGGRILAPHATYHELLARYG